ncbi:hypothetical protein MMC14_002708 [Varicellaria rhodocarpa]|nr:hypothetical protein [Varicellaria rhodocarpa]
MPSCPSCNRHFPTQYGLETHQTVKSHCHCSRCDRFFIHQAALDEHNATYHFVCHQCQQDYKSDDLRQQHQRSMRHCYCHECDRFYKDNVARDQHIRHSPRHRASLISQRRECSKSFQNRQAPDQHISDEAHIPKQTPLPQVILLAPTTHAEIKCPSGSKCDRQFGSLPAAIQHLESGACSSGINREKIFTFFQKTDTDRLIISGVHKTLTEFPEDFDTESEFLDDDAISTPSSTSGILLDQSDPLSRAMAHLGLKNCSCAQCPKTFRNAKDLENHMNSPIHLPKIFHCGLPPGSFGYRTFRTLSDLVRHLRSGACKKGQGSSCKRLAYIEENLSEL